MVNYFTFTKFNHTPTYMLVFSGKLRKIIKQTPVLVLSKCCKSLKSKRFSIFYYFSFISIFSPIFIGLLSSATPSTAPLCFV